MQTEAGGAVSDLFAEGYVSTCMIDRVCMCVVLGLWGPVGIRRTSTAPIRTMRPDRRPTQRLTHFWMALFDHITNPPLAQSNTQPKTLPPTTPNTKHPNSTPPKKTTNTRPPHAGWPCLSGGSCGGRRWRSRRRCSGGPRTPRPGGCSVCVCVCILYVCVYNIYAYVVDI